MKNLLSFLSTTDPSNARGFSTIEFVVGCAISLVVISALCSLLTVARFSKSRLKEYSRNELSLTRGYLKIDDALDAIETHSLSLGWRIHHRGVVTLADGTLHPVMKLRTTALPKADSDILSVLDLADERTAKVESLTRNGGRILLRACLPIAATQKQEDFRSYILIGVEGAVQIAGSGTGGGSGCFSLSATAVRSVFTNTAKLPNSAQLIIPVRREFSIYVDRTSELRILNHVGSMSIENQPLTRGISSIGLEESLLNNRILSFQIRLDAGSKQKIDWIHLVAIPRAGGWNVLFS